MITKRSAKRKEKPQKEVHVCDECAHGTYDMKFHNLSLEGKPTLICCPFVEGGFKRLLHEKACENFQAKPLQQ